MKKSKEKRTIERKEEERSIWYPTAAEGIKKISFHTNPLLLSPTSSIFICWSHSGVLLYEIPVKFLVLPGPSYHTSFRWFPLLLSLENCTWTHCNSWHVTPFPKIFIYPWNLQLWEFITPILLIISKAMAYAVSFCRILFQYLFFKCLTIRRGYSKVGRMIFLIISLYLIKARVWGKGTVHVSNDSFSSPTSFLLDLPLKNLCSTYKSFPCQPSENRDKAAFIWLAENFCHICLAIIQRKSKPQSFLDYTKWLLGNSTGRFGITFVFSFMLQN